MGLGLAQPQARAGLICTSLLETGVHSRALTSGHSSLVVYWTPAYRPGWNQHPAGIDLDSLPRQPAYVSGPPLSAFRNYVWPKASAPNLELDEDEASTES